MQTKLPSNFSPTAISFVLVYCLDDSASLCEGEDASLPMWGNGMPLGGSLEATRYSSNAFFKLMHFISSLT